MRTLTLAIFLNAVAFNAQQLTPDQIQELIDTMPEEIKKANPDLVSKLSSGEMSMADLQNMMMSQAMSSGFSEPGGMPSMPMGQDGMPMPMPTEFSPDSPGTMPVQGPPPDWQQSQPSVLPQEVYDGLHTQIMKDIGGKSCDDPEVQQMIQQAQLPPGFDHTKFHPEQWATFPDCVQAKLMEGTQQSSMMNGGGGPPPELMQGLDQAIAQFNKVDCNDPMMVVAMQQPPDQQTSMIAQFLKSSPRWGEIPWCVQNHLMMPPSAGGSQNDGPTPQQIIYLLQETDCDSELGQQFLNSPIDKDALKFTQYAIGPQWGTIKECYRNKMLSEQPRIIEMGIQELQRTNCADPNVQRTLSAPIPPEYTAFYESNLSSTQWASLPDCVQTKLRQEEAQGSSSPPQSASGAPNQSEQQTETTQADETQQEDTQQEESTTTDEQETENQSEFEEQFDEGVKKASEALDAAFEAYGNAVEQAGNMAMGILIAIIVGAICFVLIIVLCCVWCCRRKNDNVTQVKVINAPTAQTERSMI